MLPLPGTTDLVVLPEMFTTGFTMAASEVAEPVEWTDDEVDAVDGGENAGRGDRQRRDARRR